MVTQNATNDYATAKYIVSPTAGAGNYTTITLAIAAASAGDTIVVKPGTYTENLALKAGVNLAAFTSDGDTPNVTILGKNSYSSAGTTSISNIRLKTNGDYLLSVTGNSDSIVNINSCYLEISNNDAIEYSSSSANSAIYVYDSNGNVSSNVAKLFVATGAGNIFFKDCELTNTGASVAASTISSGAIYFDWCNIQNIITTSVTGFIEAKYTRWVGIGNTTCLNIGGGASKLFNCILNSGNVSAIAVTSTVELFGCFVNSSNASLVSGAGTCVYDALSPNNNTGKVNTTTVTPATYFIAMEKNPVVQVVTTSTNAYVSTANAIPADNTIPQIGEGAQLFTLSITPRNVNNILVFNFTAYGSLALVATGIVALFQDATANALVSSLIYAPVNGAFSTLCFNYYMTAGTVASTTFQVRYGPGGATTMAINGDAVAGATTLGGSERAVLTITEYKVTP